MTVQPVPAAEPAAPGPKLVADPPAGAPGLQPSDRALEEAYEGVEFQIGGRTYRGICLTLKDGARISRLYEKAMHKDTPTDEAWNAVERLMDDFPGLIGPPDLRCTTTEFLTLVHRFCFLHRNPPAPVERTKTPAPAPPAPAGASAS